MSNQILSDLIKSHKTLNDALNRMIELSQVNNDLIHQTIVCIPHISKIYKRIMFLSKCFLRTNHNHHNEFIIDIINEYIRPNVITINTINFYIKTFIEAAPLLYFDKHELHFSFDFYKSVHSSIYEQLHLFTNMLIEC